MLGSALSISIYIKWNYHNTPGKADRGILIAMTKNKRHEARVRKAGRGLKQNKKTPNFNQVTGLSLCIHLHM